MIVGAILLFAVGVGVGVLSQRGGDAAVPIITSEPVAAKVDDQKSASQGNTPRLERDAEAEKYFRQVNNDTMKFRVTNGPVFCWIEQTAGPNFKTLDLELITEHARILTNSLRDMCKEHGCTIRDVKTGAILLSSTRKDDKMTYEIKRLYDLPGGKTVEIMGNFIGVTEVPNSKDWSNSSTSVGGSWDATATGTTILNFMFFAQDSDTVKWSAELKCMPLPLDDDK